MLSIYGCYCCCWWCFLHLCVPSADCCRLFGIRMEQYSYTVHTNSCSTRLIHLCASPLYAVYCAVHAAAAGTMMMMMFWLCQTENVLCRKFGECASRFRYSILVTVYCLKSTDAYIHTVYPRKNSIFLIQKFSVNSQTVRFVCTVCVVLLCRYICDSTMHKT